MGLSSSLWTSVSGLLAHGEKMNVVGNNLANVSTIGFKSQRMDFEDFIYQDKFSAGGTTQIGLGVGINAVLGDFSQGAFESTNRPTDLAIGGSGYFQVRDQYTEEVYYTRAGNFDFDEQGYLRLPSGETLQGWKVDNSSSPTLATGSNPVISAPSPVQGSGVPTDIILDTYTVAPKATTKVQFTMNLTSDPGNDKTTSATNPLFAMSDRWDGTQPPATPDTPPLSADAYSEPASITVYDEGGSAHDLTVYFDQVATDNIEGLPTGYRVYEYLVTMDPSEDMRSFGGTYDETTGVLTGGTSFQDTKAAGILMKGTITFNGSGQMISQSAYTYMGNTDYADDEAIGAAADATVLGHPDNAGSWQPTAVSSDGYPVFTANFSGNPLANSVRQESSNTFPDASNHLIEFNLGMKATGNLDDPWGTGAPVTPGNPSSSIGTLVDADPATPGGIDYNNLANFDIAETEPSATVNQSGASITYSRIQDGYMSGSLTNIDIDGDGILYGYYTNGISLPLYQITMYDFINEQGLQREGGNLFSATRESGNPMVGPANEAGFGEIVAYNIEQSNVDMTREFVQMIATQRGFQSNSKGITTVDTMLEQVINMKR